MAVTNFKQNLWVAALLTNFHRVSIGDAISTSPVRMNGAKAIFNRLGAGTIKDYSGSIEWDDISTTPVELAFDKKKYFAFSLDDCDAVQLAGPIMSEVTAEHAAKLAEQYDTDILAEAATGIASAMTIGSASSKKTITPRNAYDYIVELSTLLAAKKVPKANCFVVVGADYLGVLAKDKRFTSNPNVLANGIVEGQVIANLQVVQSQELPANKIIAMHRSAVGAGKQINEVEAMRLQASFSDGVRGLMQYGVKTLRDDAAALLHCTIDNSNEMIDKVEITNTTANPVNTKEVAASAG